MSAICRCAAKTSMNIGASILSTEVKPRYYLDVLFSTEAPSV